MQFEDKHGKLQGISNFQLVFKVDWDLFTKLVRAKEREMNSLPTFH